LKDKPKPYLLGDKFLMVNLLKNSNLNIHGMKEKELNKLKEELH
jgi:hypothetical protein